MATVATKLSIAEFEKQYGGEKPYYEYWYGEPIQKSMPNWLHSVLQSILGELLRKAGFRTGSEVKLKIAPDFHPIPDVVATCRPIQLPYPTTGLDVVVEILSEDDLMSRLLTKCRMYDNWGFEQVYVVDPLNRLVFRWQNNSLQTVNALAGIPADQIWSAVDRELSPNPE